MNWAVGLACIEFAYDEKKIQWEITAVKKFGYREYCLQRTALCVITRSEQDSVTHVLKIFLAGSSLIITICSGGSRLFQRGAPIPRVRAII